MNERIEELLAIWKAAARKPTPQELCADCPEFIPLLIDRIRELNDAGPTRPIEKESPDGIDPLSLLSSPKTIGHYRILERLGDGGMGTVYKAEQRFPIKRIVALKLIKPGFDSGEIIARFESERQALARMDHPNIAKVLDAGTDDRDRPYFVMEYVPGSPITRFCDDNKLSIRQRLELFMQVCDAISHAHTKALIHRDIKAGNVLAYTTPEGPRIKVIDFGIAKALTADRLTDRTFNTARGEAIGTYESMSPEQADGSPDIDTRTDVYSLGALLYELLSGAKPFDQSKLANAADQEIRRIIREVEPPRPSTQLSTMGGEGTKAATARQTRIEALTLQLRRELEWIPLKAMRKERARRYASPRLLAEDVANYLHGKPLTAGPENTVYRIRKFAGRNRVGIGIAAAFIILIGVGIGALSVAYGKLRLTNAELNASNGKLKNAIVEVDDQKRLAEANATRANEKAREAQLQLAQGYLAEGDALAATQHWDDARVRYREADSEFKVLGITTYPAQLALWETFLHSPPPLVTLFSYGGAVNDATFLPDGIHVLSAGADQIVTEWDSELGIETRSARLNPQSASCAAISNDGELILLGGTSCPLTLWNRKMEQVVRVWPDVTNVECLAISDDKRVGVVGTASGAIRYCDLSNDQEWSSPVGHSGPVKCLAISSDHRMLLSGGVDKTVKVWDIASGNLLQNFTGHADQVFGVAFSPDGKYALSGSGDFRTRGRASILCMWDIATGSVYRTFEGHASGISSVAFSPDGSRVLSGGWDGSVKLWDVAVGSTLKTFCGHKGRIACLRFSPDGKRALSADVDGIVRVWSTKDWGELRNFTGHEGAIQTVTVSSDGRLALTGGGNFPNGEAELWDVATGRKLCGWKQDVGVVTVALSTNSQSCAVEQQDGMIVVRDLGTGRVLRSLGEGPGGFPSAVAFSSDGRNVLSGGNDWTLRLRELSRGTELGRITNVPLITCVALARDNSVAAVGCYTGELISWDISANHVVRPPVTKANHMYINSIALSSDGSLILLASKEDKAIQLRDGKNLREIKTIKCDDPVYAIVFGQNDQFAFSGHYYGGINVWEVPTGRNLRNLFTSAGTVTALAVSDDGLSLISRDANGWARIYDFSRVPKYAGFEPQIAEAQRKLATDPNDASALAVFGEWYAFRGFDDWAVNLLEKSRADGAEISPLTLARCYWKLDELPQASREFARASEQSTDPNERSYFQLCLSATDREEHTFNSASTISLPIPLSVPVSSRKEMRDAPDFSKLTPQFSSEDFRRDSVIMNNPRGKIAGKAGVYFIESSPGTFWVWDRPWGNIYSDFACEVVGRVASGAGGAWSLYLTNQGPPQQGISVTLGGDGTLEVGQNPFADRTVAENHIWPFRNPAIKPGNKFNQLLIVFRGQELAVFVNGVLVCEPVHIQQHVLPGVLELSGSAGPDQASRVEFTSCSVWQLGG